jgi:hypothetical protein
MKARDLANVLLKLLGIYWFVQGVILLIRDSMMPFMGLQSVAGFNWKLEVGGTLLYMVLYAVMSYLLVFRTGWVLRLIALDEAPEGSDASESEPGYGPLAFSLLGAFFAIPAFGHVLSDVIKWLGQWSDSGAYYGMFKQSILMNTLPALAGDAATLLIGIALIIGRKRLGPLWKRLRPLAVREDGNEAG